MRQDKEQKYRHMVRKMALTIDMLANDSNGAIVYWEPNTLRGHMVKNDMVAKSAEVLIEAEKLMGEVLVRRKS